MNVRRPKTFRQEVVHRHLQRFLAAVSENPLRRIVEHENPMLRVHRDDSVHCRADDAGQLRLGMPQLLGGVHDAPFHDRFGLIRYPLARLCLCWICRKEISWQPRLHSVTKGQ
jgi:hypothetical protein